MADIHSPLIRSYNMSRIKSKNTKPEMIVRKYLFSNGYRFRLHDKKLPGSPDIVLPKYKTIIFINGCFWHGHSGCRYFVIPKTRTQWWTDKINKNITNDELNINKLTSDGWKVISVWECELKSSAAESTLLSLTESIKINARILS